MNHHTEPHPLLAEPDSPSFTTSVTRAVHQLHQETEVIRELVTLLKGLKGIRPPEKWGSQYSGTEWVGMVARGEYAAARRFILQNHA